MQTKLAKLKAAARRGDWSAALAIAARFPRLGVEQTDIKRAHECLNGQGRSFYGQLGFDPDALVRTGIDALIRRYDLNPKEQAMNAELANVAAMFKPTTEQTAEPKAKRPLPKPLKPKAEPMTKEQREAARKAKHEAARKPAKTKTAEKAEKAPKAVKATAPAPKAKKAASDAPVAREGAFVMDPAAFATGWKQVKGHMTQTHKGWEVDTWKEGDAWQAVLTNPQGVFFRGVGETFRKAIKAAAART